MLTFTSARLTSITAQCLVAAAMMLCAAPASSQLAPPQNMVVEVIQLRYRTSQELVPILQPMLAPGAGISGLPGQLVVRTTPTNLEEIKRILASVDTQPRQLLITVRQDADISSERASTSVSGSVGGNGARVAVPPTNRDPRGGNVVVGKGDNVARVHIIEGRSNENSSNTQSIRVMEGREAYISIGQSIPVRGRQVRRSMVNGQVVEQVVDSTQYRDVSTGFYVLPRVSGDRVTLDISPQRESLSRQVPGGVSVQSVVTTVSGRIGDWIELGGIGQDASGQQTVLFGTAAASTRDLRRVQVRVEDVPQ
ncbi:MAG TPA: secretin N-terminal domain-containing protein [Burkholderiales bacterium]|nr:secretin N-terminal domain-containing protein [Burkholderiales bacterium]